MNTLKAKKHLHLVLLLRTNEKINDESKVVPRIIAVIDLATRKNAVNLMATDVYELIRLRTIGYQNEFDGLRIKVSFGQGVPAKIPWIAFLGKDQRVQKGIYPVYLFYKNIDKLVLAYCISETEKPSISWDLPELKTIRDHFLENKIVEPRRYGSSYIFKSYDTTNLPEPDIINKDLIQIINTYKKRLNLISTETEEIPENSNGFNYHAFKESIERANLFFDNKLLARFVASLLTKPFVILTGLSGSGKTKLAQAFAQWICADHNQYCILPVGADWTNREPILGFPNALKEGDYVKPDNHVLDVISSANNKQDLPHFIILDEMNLSHVERYFSDFLSVMESGEEITLFHEGASQNNVPAKLKLPSNLFIIGTVNIDETTYMFSPKVLDRANTIEFRVTKEELGKFFQINRAVNMDSLKTLGAPMAKNFLDLARNLRFENQPIKDISEVIISFFDHLKRIGAEFGFRTSSELMRLINQLTIVEPAFSLNEKVDIAIISGPA